MWSKYLLALPIFANWQKERTNGIVCVRRTMYETHLDSVNGYPELEWNMHVNSKHMTETTEDQNSMQSTEFALCARARMHLWCHVCPASTYIHSNENFDQYACQRDDHIGKSLPNQNCVDAREMGANELVKIFELTEKIIQILTGNAIHGKITKTCTERRERASGKEYEPEREKRAEQNDYRFSSLPVCSEHNVCKIALAKRQSRLVRNFQIARIWSVVRGVRQPFSTPWIRSEIALFFPFVRIPLRRRLAFSNHERTANCCLFGNLMYGAG